MKLLYATSIMYPSSLANRLQILSTFKALNHIVPESVLGVSSLKGDVPFPVAEFPGSQKSAILGYKYARYIRTHGITHLYCREDYLLFFIILWSRLMGSKVYFFFEAHKLHEGWAFPRILKQVDGIVSITHGLKEDLVAQGIPPTKIVIAPDAVDLERFTNLPDKETLRNELGIPRGAFVAAYAGGFGGLHPWKGADILLEAAMTAAKGISFILVGGRPGELEDFRARYVRENIRLEGNWAPSEVPKLLMAADVLIIPNKRGPAISERHTSPMKLFEYMAAGKAIVASDLPSIREVVSEKEVFFFEPNNPFSLLDSIEYVRAHPEEAAKRAKRAGEEVQKHTWDKRAETILAFLKQRG